MDAGNVFKVHILPEIAGCIKAGSLSPTATNGEQKKNRSGFGQPDRFKSLKCSYKGT